MLQQLLSSAVFLAPVLAVPFLQTGFPDGVNIGEILNNITYAAFAGIVAYVVWRRHISEMDKQREHY